MRVLVTGATGFLGKRVLDLLIADPRVAQIDAVSRSKRTHPSPKVRILRHDLSDPAFVHHLMVPGFEIPDCVIHIAGVYDFKSSFAENYQQNVLSTVNVMSLLKEWNRKRRVPVLFASTYGVGFGLSEGVGERPLSEMPPKAVPYAFTKAVAERAVTDARVPAMIFRLGVLVGDLQCGEIEKSDGPYALMGLLRGLARGGVSRFLKVVPVPAKKAGVIPLVPVDLAAKVIHEGAMRATHGDSSSDVKIYGVYNSQSASIESFCRRVVAEYLPGAHVSFVNSLPRQVLSAQEAVTGIPKDAFRFSSEPLPLENPAFVRDFPDLLIPEFESYERTFFEGFEDYCGVAAAKESAHG